MAKGLETLSRLNEWNVEQKRRKLGEIMGLIDRCEGEARKLEEDLVKEQAAAASSPSEAGFLYGNFAERVIDRRAIIQLSIQPVETQADEAREEVSEAYRDLKKYEKALEARKKREEKEIERKEQIVIDEVATQAFIQKRAV